MNGLFNRYFKFQWKWTNKKDLCIIYANVKAAWLPKNIKKIIWKWEGT